MQISLTDVIQIWMTIITAVGIIISLVISLITLHQNKKIIEFSNKADIIFYIDYNPQIDMYFLIVKNFGKSVGKLKSIDISPKLDWKKTKFGQDLEPLTKAENVLLAPNQKISSWFDFKDYPDKKFNISIKYTTNGRDYVENYTIDLNYIKNIDWLTQYAMDDTTENNKEVLYKINNSIRDLTDKFR